MARRKKYCPVLNAWGVYWIARYGRLPKFPPLWVRRYNFADKKHIWEEVEFLDHMPAGYWRGSVGYIRTTNNHSTKQIDIKVFGPDTQIILGSELHYYLSLGLNLAWVGVLND